jgi:hypothetical protein
MITGKDAWNIVAKGGSLGKLPNGYGFFYRSTKFSEWRPVKFHWCIYRDHYYEGSKNTGQHSYEICCGNNNFLWEKNKYDFEKIGVDFIEAGNAI